MEHSLDKTICRIGRVVVDESLHTQNADEAFFSFFGNDAIYSIRRTIEEEDYPRLEESLRLADAGGIRRTVVRMCGISGEMSWVLASVKRITAEGEPPLYEITLSDIFSLGERTFSAERSASELRYYLSLISDLAFEYSFETGRIKIFMFDACRSITIADELLDKWQKDAIDSGMILSRYTDTFSRLCDDIRNGVYRFDHELETSLLTFGKIREMCLFRGVTRYTEPKKKLVSGIISVVSARLRTKEINLAIEANRDQLSGLLSKNTVTAVAMDILAGRPSYNVNLVILDIDDFTDINKSYGHLFGDEVVYTVAGIIKKEIGERGYAGRISGSSFLIIIEDTRDETDLRGILRAIRTNTESAFSERADNFQMTCSMGISTYPVDSTEYDELFMQADKALYIAQQKGKNRYVIYDIEKHGPVEKDIENKIAFLSSKKDATEKLVFAGDIAESLVFGSLPDISVLLEQIRKEFAIDDICIYAGNEMNLILSCGNSNSKRAAYLLENRYTERFSGDGIFTIDNVNELEGRDDNAFAQLTAENTGGAVQYLMTDESIVKGMISFCYIGRFKKWSVTDQNYFAILGRMIFAILKRQAFI